MRLKQGVILRELTQGVMLYDPEADEAYALNETGALVLKMALDGKDETEIAEALAREYEVDAEGAAKDARELLDELQRLGLLLG